MRIGYGMCSPLETVDETELIKNRLYFATVSARPTHQIPGFHLFTTDDQLLYCNYNADFGPLNLAMLYRFCDLLNRKLKLPTLVGKRIVYYTGTDVCKRTNAAFLIGSYMVLYLGRTADEAYVAIAVGSSAVFRPFRDASPGPSTYNLTLLDTLHAVEKASLLRFLDFCSFNVDEYEHYEKVENGDLNWIVPQKFLAFSSPHAQSKIINGYAMHAPEAYLPYFKRNNVTVVIRLNNKLYESTRFTAAGIAHYDLFFTDGGTPDDDIVQRFLSICEKADGAIAVHCKAGLGRTGTLIGCFLMKHFKLTAAETIAWTRIARPGSILGPQQHFLQSKQQEMWKQGDAYRRQLTHPNSNQKTTGSVETKSLPSVDKLATCGSSQHESPLIVNGSSQGDQLNRLKLQRCRQSQGHSQGQTQSEVQKQKPARESVKRPLEVDVNQSNSLFRSYRRTRPRH